MQIPNSALPRLRPEPGNLVGFHALAVWNQGYLEAEQNKWLC